jgi:hypothetical protein
MFDNQMNPVISSNGKNIGADPVGDDNELKTHTITQREMSRSGYLYFYVSIKCPFNEHVSRLGFQSIRLHQIQFF